MSHISQVSNLPNLSFNKCEVWKLQSQPEEPVKKLEAMFDGDNRDCFVMLISFLKCRMTVIDSLNLCMAPFYVASALLWRYVNRLIIIITRN